MSISTLEKLKDELVNLYGEDQIAGFQSMLARKQVSEWLKNGNTKINNTLSFGNEDPNNPAAIADYSVTFAGLLARFEPAGQQAKAVRARSIVFAYTLWENVYRPTIKQECGVDSVENNEFGDLRLYRNAILHHRGKLHTDTTVLKVFSKGELIAPTADQLREIFKQLVAGLNTIGKRYYGENPGFEWGRKLNA